MGFLNSALLFGATVAALPILLHWWNRHPPKIVHWGAMHLFESELTKRSKRFDWQTLLLLLLRCAIPTAFAFCLARPVLTAFILPGSTESAAIGIVLDDSLSMSSRIGNETCFDIARREILGIVDANPRAEVEIWLAGEPPKLLQDGDRLNLTELKAELDGLRPACGKLNAENAISIAKTSLLRKQPQNKHLVVISDFRTADWRSVSEKDRQQDSQRDAAQMHFIDLGNTSRPAQNISIHSEPSNANRCNAGQPVTLGFRVANYSKAVFREEVILRMDQQQIQKRQVNVPPGESMLIEFPLQIADVGSYLIEASLEDEHFRADNRTLHLLEVIEAPQVLIIHPELTSDADLARDTQKSLTYLELALAPFAAQPDARFEMATGDSQLNRFELTAQEERTTLKSLKAKGSSGVQHYAAIILLEPSNFEMVHLLEPYVREGGGVLILPSDSTSREQLSSQSDSILPGRLIELRTQKSAARVAPGRIQMPGFEVFNSQAAGTISDISLKSWWRIERSDDATTVLSLGNGDPLMLTRTIDAGRIVLAATSVGETLSDMAFRPAFVTLMQTTVQYCLGNPPSPNLQCGAYYGFGPIPNMLDPPKLLLNGEHPIALDASSGNWILRNTRYCGMYAFDAEISKSEPYPELARRSVVVKPDASESELSRLSQGELANLERNGSLHFNAREFQALLTEQKEGKEIWQWLLMATLCFLVLETWFAGKLTRSGI